MKPSWLQQSEAHQPMRMNQEGHRQSGGSCVDPLLHQRANGREHLGARAVFNHVACNVDSTADLCSLCHLSCCLCGRSSGLPPGVVHQRDPEISRGGEGHPGAEGGEEAAGTSGYGQHTGA